MRSGGAAHKKREAPQNFDGVLSFRHPERSRGIFLVAAVYGMHAAAQKTARALISHSPFHWCARKISRFARNDDTGKAVIREETSPSFHWKEVPRRGGGWLSQRDERECEIVLPLASSSRAQPRDLSCRSGVRHACGCSKNRSDAHLTLSVSPVCKEDFSLCSK